jgi:hypothetical protein
MSKNSEILCGKLMGWEEITKIPFQIEIKKTPRILGSFVRIII